MMLLLADLLAWWKQLSALGGVLCEYIKVLVVKEDCYDAACHLFAGTSLRITTEGHPYLGVPPLLFKTSRCLSGEMMSCNFPILPLVSPICMVHTLL